MDPKGFAPPLERTDPNQIRLYNDAQQYGDDGAAIQALAEAEARGTVPAPKPSATPAPAAAVNSSVASEVQRRAGTMPGAGAMPSGNSEQAAIAEWQTRLGDDQAIIDLKKALYWAGMYGDGGVSLRDTLTDSDVSALQKAMSLGALNGQDWQAVIQPMAQEGLAAKTPYNKIPGLGSEQDADVTGQAKSALEQFADENGITLSKDYLDRNAAAVGTGQTTLDDLFAGLRKNYVAQAYPAWKDQIEGGANVSDLAQPYLQTMQSMLELPQGAVSLKDKSVQKALSAVDDKGNPTYMPLWQFKDQLRQDPRWASTENAWDEVGSQMAGLAEKLGI